MSWYWKVIIVTVLLVAGGAAQFLLTQREAPPSAPLVESGAEVIVPQPSIVDPAGGGYNVRVLPVPKTETTSVPTAPNLDLVIAGVVPRDDYEKLVFSNLQETVEVLKKDPENYDDWLAVGISLKQLEKYEAARDAFLYVSSLWPTQPVPQGNLGSLYHLYLKDFPKSEAAYKKAIELDSTQANWHRGLYELYRYSYKQNTSAWEETLTAGIEATGALDLMAALAERYTDLKRFTEAVVLYDRAIAAAEKQENSGALVDRLIALRAAARAEVK